MGVAVGWAGLGVDTNENRVYCRLKGRFTPPDWASALIREGGREYMSRRTKISVAAAICAMALAGAAPVASAQSGAQQGYDESGVLGTINHEGGSGSSGPSDVNAVSSGPSGVNAVSSDSSSLPFTGLDVGILVALGGAVAGTGFVLRRTVRDPAQ